MQQTDLELSGIIHSPSGEPRAWWRLEREWTLKQARDELASNAVGERTRETMSPPEQEYAGAATTRTAGDEYGRQSYTGYDTADVFNDDTH